MRVNPKSHLIEMSRLVKMPHLVEIPQLVSWKFYSHNKLWHFTCEISHVATHVRACRNEIVIQWYRICNDTQCEYG